MPRKPSTKPRKPKGEKQLPNNLPIIQSTVRPQDTAARRYSTRSDVSNLLRRYAKWVKVAVGMRASGLAQLPVRWYREGEGAGEKSMRWKSRRVKDRKRTKITDGGGPGTRKSMGYIDELEEITDPTFPGNLLMDRANPWTSGFAFMESIEAAGCMAGNAYGAMVIPPRVGYPTELWALPPQHVRIVPSTTDWIAGYQYGRGSEVERFYKPDEMIPFKRSSPRGDPWYGESDMESCLPDADLSFAMSQVALALLDNGIMPGLVFCGEDWTGDQRSEAREEFEREHQGVAKIGRSLFISGKVKIDKVQIGQYEVELLQGSDDHAREVVAACFGVPLEYMTLRPSGLGDGKGVAGDQFQRLTLLPSKQRIEDELNMYLVPHFRKAMGDDSLVLCIDSPVQEDENAMWLRAGKAYTEGWVFRDEARSMASLDPVDDGKPVWGPQANAPVQAVTGPGIDGEATDGQPQAVDGVQADAAEVGATAAPTGPDVQATALNGAQVASLQEMVRAAAAKEIPLEAVTPMMQISFPNTPAELIQTLVTSLTGFEPPKPEPNPITAPGTPLAGAGKPEPDAGGDPPESGKSLANSVQADAVAATPGSLRAHLDEHAGHGHKAAGDPAPDVPTDNFEQRLRDYFSGLHPVVLNAVGEYLQAGAMGEMPAVLAGSKQATRGLVGVLMDGTTPAMQQGANAAVAEITIHAGTSDVDVWSVVPQDAIDYLRTENGKVAVDVLKGYDDQVRAKVANAIADTIGDAPTPEKIQAAVAEQLPGVSQAKAATIAQTETQHAYAAGDRKASAESEFVIGYKWLVSGDPCPFCKAMDGKIVDKNSPFLAVGESITLPNGVTLKNDYRDVIGGTAHPGCRCYFEKVYAPLPEAP